MYTFLSLLKYKYNNTLTSTVFVPGPKEEERDEDPGPRFNPTESADYGGDFSTQLLEIGFLVLGGTIIILAVIRDICKYRSRDH